MDLHAAKDLCLSKMKEHGLMEHKYTFSWNNSKRRFGSHTGEYREITLSKHIVALNVEEIVLNTILHEIAHAIDYVRNGFKYRCGKVNQQVHDRTWKLICIEIGARPFARYATETSFRKHDEATLVTVPVRYILVRKTDGEIILNCNRKPKNFMQTTLYKVKSQSDKGFQPYIWVEAPKGWTTANIAKHNKELEERKKAKANKESGT